MIGALRAVLRRRSGRLVFLALSLSFGASARSFAACEPTDWYSELEKAKTARALGQYDKAYGIADRVLSHDRSNLHARLIVALVQLDQSRSPPHPRPSLKKTAIDSLAFTASSLQDYAKLKDDRRCPENRDLYSVFNTLGVEYFKTGDATKSERAFLRGERNLAALAPEEQSKLLFNLGVYYKSRLNLNKAIGYLQRAQKANNPAAASQIEALRGLQALAK